MATGSAQSTLTAKSKKGAFFTGANPGIGSGGGAQMRVGQGRGNQEA